MKRLTVGIIGLGVMGHAIRQRLASLTALTVLGFDRMAVSGSVPTLHALALQSEVLLIAVKPQQFGELAAELKPLIVDQLIISIMAGVPTATIQRSLGQSRVVRTMPNIAAQVGESVTGWYANPSVSAGERKLVRTLLSSIGSELELAEERSLDVLTAISGSGPGYLFSFAKAMVEAARSLGFSADVAEELVRQTLVGAAAYAEASGESFGELTKAVTSKGGTTESALAVFDQAKLEPIVQTAVRAAHQRSQALAKEQR